MAEQIIRLDDPRIAEFSNLKTKEWLTLGRSVLDGENVVKRALLNGIKILKVLVIEKNLKHAEKIIDCESCQFFFASKEIIESIIGHRFHQGFMALCELPKLLSIQEMIASKSTIVCLDGISSPENVGTIVRTSAAFGVPNILYGSKGSSPYLQRSIRVSMGNVFSRKIALSENLESDISYLKRGGYEVVSIEIEENAIPIQEFFCKKYKKEMPYTFIFGSEGQGISPEILEQSTVVRIPIDLAVESINVAHAASIFLYHWHSA